MYCRNDYSIHQDIYNGNYNFTDSTFTCTHVYRGGALLIEGDANICITRCIFNKCNNTHEVKETFARGGAIWCSSSGKFECFSSNFTECHANEGDSFLSLWNGNERIIDHCLFSKGNTLRYGGVNIELCPENTVVHRCTFENGTSGEYGGGAGLMFVHINLNLTVSECIFQHSSSDWHSAGIFFYFQPGEEATNFLLIFLKFNNNKANTG